MDLEVKKTAWRWADIFMISPPRQVLYRLRRLRHGASNSTRRNRRLRAVQSRGAIQYSLEKYHELVLIFVILFKMFLVLIFTAF